MEYNKKKRNSILKKPAANEDDTTAEITGKIKRRISFSGKKSVKEFIAGEKEATIWGISYEEIAESSSQANLAESGLVNVNEKRIVLRNRRVVVDPNRETKRRAKGKKVLVAEHDKENVFVQQPQSESQCETTTIEPVDKVKSAVKPELALVRSNLEEVKTKTVSEAPSRLNVCSNTLDFINCSALINKSIVVEHSLDVTLSDNELQMFKFRIPVAAIDVSPNWSVSSVSDASSQNNFSRSILLTEEDVNLLKMMRGTKGVKNSTGIEITEIETEELGKRALLPQKGNTDVNSKTKVKGKDVKDKKCNPIEFRVDISPINKVSLVEVEMKASEDKRRGTLHMNQSISVSHCEVADAKGSNKRVTLTQPIDMEADNVNENNVHPQKGILMNLLRGNVPQAESGKRATMFMNQAMDVSQDGVPVMRNLKRKTITKVVNIEEANLDPNPQRMIKIQTTGIDSSAMDLNSPLRKKPMHNTTCHPMDTIDLTVETTSQLEPTRRKTNHFQSAMNEESLTCNPAEINHQFIDAPKCSRQTIHFDDNRIQADNDFDTVEAQQIPNDSIELSVCAPTKNSIAMDESCRMEMDRTSGVQSAVEKQSSAINRKTIHFIEEEQMDISKPRQSIHTRADMIEDSLRGPVKVAVSGVVSRQSIYTTVDIIEEPEHVVVGAKITDNQPESIYNSTDILEDSPKPTKSIQATHHQTIKVPVDIFEDTPRAPVSSCSGVLSPRNILKERNSIYMHLDIIEDPPGAKDVTQSLKSNASKRQTICDAVDIIDEPSVPVHKETTTCTSVKKRESVYTPLDIIVDSPKAIRSTQATKVDILHHQTTGIHAPTIISTDETEDSSRQTRLNQANKSKVIYKQAMGTHGGDFSNSINQQQSIYASKNISKDPSEAGPVLNRKTIYSTLDIQPKVASKVCARKRESIYTPTDIIEDSPSVAKTTEEMKSDMRHRKTVHTPAGIMEAPPVLTTKQTQEPKSNVLQRKSIYTHADIVEDSPVLTTKQTQEPKSNVLQRKSIHTHADIVEDSPVLTTKQTQEPKSNVLQRKSIHTHADIVEDSPVLTTKQTQEHKLNVLQSFYMHADITEDSPVSTKKTQGLKSNVLHRQSIYTHADIVEDSLVLTTKQTQEPKSNVLQRKSIYTHADIIEDSPVSTKQTQGPMKPLHHDTKEAHADIIEDSPNGAASSTQITTTTQASHYLTMRSQESSAVSALLKTAPSSTQLTNLTKHPTMRSHVLQVSPKSAPSSNLPTTTASTKTVFLSTQPAAAAPPKLAPSSTQPALSAPKVIVKHLNLQQGLTFDQAALRVIKNQPANMETKADDDSFMDMTLLNESEETSNKMNFCKLNEEMWRRETKTFGEERKKTMSLFDRLEKKSEEEVQFDPYMDKSNQIGYVIQPGRNSMKDYTMELSTRKTLDYQREGESEYTIDLPVEKTREKCPTKSINPLESELIVGSNNKTMDLSIETQQKCRKVQSKRGTIHFHEEIDLDVSTNSDPVVEQNKNQSRKDSMDFSRFPKNLEEEPNPSRSNFETMDLSMQDVPTDERISDLNQNSAITAKNRQTIHFNQNNELEESLMEKSSIFSREKRFAKDDSTMDLSMQEVHQSSRRLNLEPTKRGTVLYDQRLEEPLPKSGFSRSVRNDCMERSTIVCESPPKTSRSVRSVCAKRGTILCNKELEESLQKSSRSMRECTKRGTILCVQGLEESPSISIFRKSVRNDCTNRDTFFCDQEVEESPVRNECANRGTIICDQGLEECSKRDTILPDQGLERNFRNPSRSIHLNAAKTANQIHQPDEDTMNVSATDIQRSSTQPKRKTILIHHTMDLDESSRDLSGIQLPNRPGCQTITCNKDLEFEDINSGRPLMPQISQASNRQINLEVENINEGLTLPSIRNRQTIHFNQDLEVEDINEKQDHHHLNQEDINKNSVLKKSKRQTLHLHEDIEFDEEEAQQVTLFKETQKNTAVNSLRLPNLPTNRKTILFHKNNDLEVTAKSFQEEPPMDLSIADGQEEPRILTKPRRILDVQPFEEPLEKITVNKASFSRNLNFNEFPTAIVDKNVSAQEHSEMKAKSGQIIEDEDSPLYYYNAKSKNYENTSEIDRSLAEYLKAEAAATLYRSNSADMSMDIVDERESALEDEVHVLKTRRQTTLDRVNMLNESGMQPLPKTAVRRQTTFIAEDMANEDIDYRERISQRLTVKPKDMMEDAGVSTQRTNLHETRDQIETQSNVQANRIKAQAFDGLQKSRIYEKDLEAMISTEEGRKHISDRSFKKSPNKDNYLRQSKQNREQTHMEPEIMEISLHSSEEPSKLSKPAETLSRKTIHFDNENAVDESFFDETMSKPAPAQNRQNRQTLFFNEPIDPSSDMEVTKTKSIIRSKAVQSIRDICRESNLLFTQTNQLKPFAFENQRSTIYFAEKDYLMDVTTANEKRECENMEPECTPTKRKSRIPQLIDSAKKLLSMKKSIEFIQQELPSLGCHIPREEEAKNLETPTKTANSMPKKQQGTPNKFDITRRVTTFKPRQLQDSLDAVDISRGAAAISRKATIQEQRLLQESFETAGIPRRATRFEMNLQESSDTVEISRRTTTFEPRQLQESFNTVDINPRSPRQLQESFDTVEIPRRVTNFQRNDTLYFCPNEMETTNPSRKSVFKFEDEPITITDDTTCFAQKLLPSGEQVNETYSPNTTEALCNLDVNQLPKSSDSEDTAHDVDKFKKRYIELTCDSIMISRLGDDIEKTHLSLVNTLDEASEVVQPVSEIPPPPPAAEPSKTNSSVWCRKCKCNRLSLTQNDTTIGSFILEPLPEYEIDLAAIQELGNKPKISDVAKIWQQKIRESDSFDISLGCRSMALDHNETVEDFVAALDNERLMAAQRIQRKEIKKESSFVRTVQKRLQSKKSNWILNELLLAGYVLKFTHIHIRTFAIFISFTPKDARGVEVNFNDIQLVPNTLHTRQWTPFDYALHYQLLVELPFDLRKLCPSSENLFDLLEHVDQVTQEVLKIGRDMLYLVLTSPASLIREPSGSLYIRKYARMKTPQNEVKRMEFQIEVRNIKKLSYESIVAPPLYEFDEQIQLLPLGQDFLRIFLANPMRYMKP